MNNVYDLLRYRKLRADRRRMVRDEHGFAPHIGEPSRVPQKTSSVLLQKTSRRVMSLPDLVRLPHSRQPNVSPVHLPKPADVTALIQRETAGYPRRAVTKFATNYTNSRKSLRAFGRYLARGSLAAGGTGFGFDADSDTVDIAETLARYQADRYHFRLVLTLEDFDHLDSVAVTREFVATVQQESGKAFEWVGALHRNTANTHCHLVFRGVDERGRAYRFSNPMITKRMREIAQAIATRELGPLTPEEMLQARAKGIQASYFTQIDRDLIAKKDGLGRIHFPATPAADLLQAESEAQDKARLQTLQTMGLAQEVQPQTWVLSDHLEAALRAVQRAADITRSFHPHRQFLRDPNAKIQYTALSSGTVVSGRVVGTGLADPTTDTRYLLIEGDDGKVHFLIQDEAMEAARGDGRLRNGSRAMLLGQTLQRDGQTVTTTVILSLTSDRKHTHEQSRA